MSIEDIKRNLIHDVPIITSSKGVADVLSILLDSKIVYKPHMKGSKIYNCQSLYFKEPQPCKYRLNLKTMTTEESQTDDIEDMDFSTSCDDRVIYNLNINNEYFPDNISSYKIYFTSDRLNVETHNTFYPQIVKIIKQYISNIILLDSTPFQGACIINICNLDKDAIVVTGETDELNYNGLINNWKIFNLQNNHQFFRNKFTKILEDDKLIFTPNIFYSEHDTSILNSPLFDKFSLVMIKIHKEKLGEIETIKNPSQVIHINNEQMILFYYNKRDNNDYKSIFDKLMTEYNLHKPPLPHDYFKVIGQKSCQNLFGDIGHIIKEYYPESIRYENPIFPKLEKETLNYLYIKETKRKKLYNNIKQGLKEKLKLVRRLEAPKLLLRYVFALIIKRKANDDPIFITSDLNFGSNVISGDTKYFKISKHLTNDIIRFLQDEFNKASNEMQNVDQYSDDIQNISIEGLIKMRYEYLELSTMGLAYPYADEGYLRDDDILECFSNPINRYFKNFCTAFPDLEGYTGEYTTKGSFWDMQVFPYKKLVLNPPFDETIIIEMFKKVMVILTEVGNIDIEIILPNWSDMKQIKEFIEGKINIPYCVYKARIIPKDNIYFIDYSVKTSDGFKKIHPCDIVIIEIHKEIFSYKEFVRECVDVKFHKLISNTIQDSNYYKLNFSPFHEPVIENFIEFPSLPKNYRPIFIHTTKEHINDTAEALEKFLSNYGDAVTSMIFNRELKDIIIYVISPNIDKFIECLVKCGIWKYTANTNSYGLKVYITDHEEFLHIYMDIDYEEKSLSKYNIKVTKSEISVIEPSTEMLLMEPMFLF